MSASILLVEDDVRLGSLLSEFLSAHGYAVSLVEDGLEAVERVRRDAPQIVVLDLMLPGLPGLEVLRRVRPGFRGGVLILTASKAEGGELEGLELGADDFVTKPVDPRILLARVRSVLRRAVNSDSASSGAPPVVVANLWLDQSSRVAKVNGAAVELTSTEWSLLWVLASRAGTVVSRDDLYTEALGTTYDGLDRGVDIHLSRLRKKLAAAGFDPAAIKSVRSVGYLMGR
jgi:DNA-binding response OmpR family regulator